MVAAVLGGYRRMESIMTALLMVILVSFIVVAIKGLLDWSTWPALAGGLVPQIPADLPVIGQPGRERDAFTQIMAIAGQALPPAVFLSYGYLATNSGYTRRRHQESVLENGDEPRRGVGTVLGGRDRGRRHRAASAFTPATGPTHLGVRHYSQIESIPVAGQVLGPAFPGRARIPGAAVLLARA